MKFRLSVMDRLQKADEYAEHLIQLAREKPEKIWDKESSSKKVKSLHQKLTEIYVEECGKQPEDEELFYGSNLLEKLMKKEQLNCLILNLYPGNEGYSLLLKGCSGTESETIRLSYEESELLEYIDAEELPPILVDLLEKSGAGIFYNGCVILQVRDYRRSTNGSCDTRYVLLRPTPQSLLADINNITNDGHKWTQEDKFTLESQLLLVTSEPLCLDPSLAVGLISNKLHYEKHKLNTGLLKRAVKKYSQAAVNRKRKFAQCAAPPELRLHDFIRTKKEKLKHRPPVNLKVGKSCVDMWRQRNIMLEKPSSEVNVEKYARRIEKPKLTVDNTPNIVEEYTLETEKSQGKIYHTRLVIQQRVCDEFYLGELYVDRDYVEGQKKASFCQFPLGTRANVDKYIKQFTEILTEEGRRQVKITHIVPGQPPQVTYTQTINSPAQVSLPITTAQVLLSQAVSLASNISGQIEPQSSSSVQRPSLKLSLTLNSSGGLGTSIQPNSFGIQNGAQQQQLMALQQQQQANHLKTKQRLSGISRSVASSPSPASTPTGTAPQLPSYNQATSSQSSSQTPTPTPTPPPQVPTQSSRRGSLNDSLSGSGQFNNLSQVLLQNTNLTSYLQGQIQIQSNQAAMPGTPTTPTANTVITPGDLPKHLPALQQGSTTPNLNVTSMPQGNINIQNITGLQGITNLQQLQGFQNLQVMPGGGIALPVTLSVITSSTGSSIVTPQGIFVSSLPQMQAQVTSTNSSTGLQPGSIQTGSSASPLVTMVTPINTSNSVANSSTGQPVTTTGVLTSGQSVIAGPSGMFVTGNLPQFLGIKGGTQAIRGPLLQHLPPGTLPIRGQMLGAPVRTGVAQKSGHQQVTTGQPGIQLLTARSLQGLQQASQLGQPAISSPVCTNTGIGSINSQLNSNSGRPVQVTSPQIMQIHQQQPGNQQLQTAHLLKQSPMLHQLAPYQSKSQGNLVQGQGHIQLIQNSAAMKQKTKKRTTPTPPKQ